MYTVKKSLGQHFLRDEVVSARIVEALREQPFGRLYEVGPGMGALTKYLVGLPGVDFRAVELDEEKVRFLIRQYPQLEGRVEHGSILEVPMPFEGPFMVIGNFPYNISTQIVFRILEWKSSVQGVIGMFQKEVAERIAAGPGSRTYGILSVLTGAFFHVDYLFTVMESAFHPPPKVKSAVIRMRPRDDVPSFRSEAAFRRLVKTAFNQRRKTLRNAVRGLFPAGELADPLFDRRAEQLSIDEFAALTFRMM